MNDMSKELSAAGIDVDFVAVNARDAADYQADLAKMGDFAMVQDTDALRVWDAMGGHKDDFYLYHSDGTLAVHLPEGGTLDTALSGDSEGYATLRGAAAALK